MLISPRTLERLAADERIPASSRRHLSQTARIQRSLRHRPGAAATTTATVRICDCQGLEILPGTEVDVPSTTDATAIRASHFSTEVLRFLDVCFGRDSIDDLGMQVLSSIHFSRAFSNAFWNESQLVYGDGDGLVLLDFTLSPEFVCHEIFHGVTQFSSALEYADEAGALNESVSDVFGSVFEQWRLGQSVTEAHWQIGPSLMGPTALSLGWQCVRSLADPSSPNNLTIQPKHYADYVPEGDPHDNSGIPNQAFYLAAMRLGGSSATPLGRIWFASLLDPNSHPRMTFREFAAISLQNASRLFSSVEAEAVRDAWHAVGVPV